MKFISQIPGKYTDYCRHPKDRVMRNSNQVTSLVNGNVVERSEESYFCLDCRCEVFPVPENDPDMEKQNLEEK